MKKNIKCIIFDNNGVLTTSNSETVDAICAKWLGVDEKAVREAIISLSPNLDRGKWSDDVFSTKVMRRLDVQKDAHEFSRVRLSGYVAKKDMQRFAKLLSRKYPLALLSNFGTGFHSANKRWRIERIIPKSRMLVSCDIGMCKPHANIYRYALKKLCSKASDVVFIDDNLDNVKAARKIGMYAILFTSLAQLKRELSRLGVRI